MRQMKRLTALCLMWCVAAACGGSPANPTPVSWPNGAGQVTDFRITGDTSLTAIGETRQLTATATLLDGTKKEVNAEATWGSTDPSVITVSSTGLLTVLRFGASVVSARYQNRYTSLSLTPSPPGTFVIAGVVREPGAGGVRDVTVTDTASLSSTVTNISGNYSLAALPTSAVRLRFYKEGYEVAETDATQTNGSVALQRIIRVSAGETVSPPRFAPNDLVYTVRGERCVTCRLVRLVAPAAGTFHLRVTWDEPRVILSLWANGSIVEGSTSELIADVSVPAGESIVYLALKPTGTMGGFHVPFTIESSMR
jgi:hypothetical protein